MSIPMITCAICNALITKRSSLLVEPYGRICRSHPEVEKHKERLAEIAKKSQEAKEWAQAARNLNVIMMVEQIRMLAYLGGHNLDFAWFACSFRVPREIREEVGKQVKERGPLTPQEIEQATFTAIMLAQENKL